MPMKLEMLKIDEEEDDEEEGGVFFLRLPPPPPLLTIKLRRAEMAINA